MLRQRCHSHMSSGTGKHRYALKSAAILTSRGKQKSRNALSMTSALPHGYYAVVTCSAIHVGMTSMHQTHALQHGLRQIFKVRSCNTAARKSAVQHSSATMVST